METLLDMHNAMELSSLCGALGLVRTCTPPEQKASVMAYIREGKQQAELRFAEVLKLVWEGIMFEYLRSVGMPLKNSEMDPRVLVLRHWRRSVLDPKGVGSFVPYYLERRVVPRRAGQPAEDEDIAGIRARVGAAEVAVKEAEGMVRKAQDYRMVLAYFSATRDLHKAAVSHAGTSACSRRAAVHQMNDRPLVDDTPTTCEGDVHVIDAAVVP